MDPRVLTYESTGDGEPVALVPGGLTGWLSWIPHADYLSASRHVIRVQPIHNELGSAGERGDPTYDARTERESLRLTMDALGISSADFAGWSGGGQALIEFALAYPERVRTLTLVEPAAYWILKQLDEDDPDVERLNTILYAQAGKDITEESLAQFLELAGFVADRRDAPNHPNWERWVPHKMALSWQSEAMDRFDRSIDELENIHCPVLLVKGTVTADWLKRVVDVLAARLPSATVVELEGDHACHIQSMGAFLEAFEKHLASA